MDKDSINFVQSLLSDLAHWLKYMSLYENLVKLIIFRYESAKKSGKIQQLMVDYEKVTKSKMRRKKIKNFKF